VKDEIPRKEPIVSDPDRYDPGRPPVAPCPHTRVIRIEADPVRALPADLRADHPSVFAIIQDYLARPHDPSPGPRAGG
jgi:hypothetical protein